MQANKIWIKYPSGCDKSPQEYGLKAKLIRLTICIKQRFTFIAGNRLFCDNISMSYKVEFSSGAQQDRKRKFDFKSFHYIQKYSVEIF